MQDSRAIEEQSQLLRERQRVFAVHRDGDFYIIFNTITKTKRFYARIQDVRNFLAKPVDPRDE